MAFMQWALAVLSVAANAIKLRNYGAKHWSMTAAVAVENGQSLVWPTVLTRWRLDGVVAMKTKAFNQAYAVGSHFIYQRCKVLCSGYPDRTVAGACGTIVEIDREPFLLKQKH